MNDTDRGIYLTTHLKGHKAMFMFREEGDDQHSNRGSVA